MASRQVGTGYHIVAAVGEEGQLAPLLTVACALAGARGGRVTILSVTTSGRHPVWLQSEPPSGLGNERPDDPNGLDRVATEPARSAAMSLPAGCDGVSVDIVVRAGRNPGDEILAEARKDSSDLILLGWRGGDRRAVAGRYLLGGTLDPVVQYAPCDVAVVRAEGGKRSLEGAPESIERVLIPAGGGPNAALAIELALSLSPHVQVTALNVAREVQGEVALSLGRERLDGILEPWVDEPRVQGKVIQASSAVRGILTEAAQDYDLVMIGASHESYLDRVLFGNIPQAVAAHSPAPAIVVKRHTRRMRMGTWLRRGVWRLFDILPTLDLHQQLDVYKAIREGAEPKIDFFVMIALSAAIASLGLLLNSPAVIIGAMLVAPLMAAIFGLSLAVVRGDLKLLRRAASATLRGMLLAIFVGFVVGILYALLASSAISQQAILSRTQPNLLDLGVALASGAAGAYALCRREVSAALPGVAIAAALVPPLAVVGIGLGAWVVEFAELRILGEVLGRVETTGGRIAGGALLLFLTNLVAITAVGGMVFLWLGFRPRPGRQARAQVFQRGMVGTVLLLAAVTILLGILSVQSLRESAVNRALNQALEREIGAMYRVELESWEIVPAEDGDETVRVLVWVRSPRDVAYQEVVGLQERLESPLARLAGQLNKQVVLVLSVIPTTQLDPFVPPTPTPTLPPGATATFTPSPT
ncbi:DUF389 domain-containing protein [Chloroflexota bacterium]